MIAPRAALRLCSRPELICATLSAQTTPSPRTRHTTSDICQIRRPAARSSCTPLEFAVRYIRHFNLADSNLQRATGTIYTTTSYATQTLTTSVTQTMTTTGTVTTTSVSTYYTTIISTQTATQTYTTSYMQTTTMISTAPGMCISYTHSVWRREDTGFEGPRTLLLERPMRRRSHQDLTALGALCRT